MARKRVNKKDKRQYTFFALLFISLFFMILPFIIFRERMYVITSNSMSPTLNVGDLVIKGDKKPEDIKAGEEDGDILILKGPEYFYDKGFDPIFWGNLEEDTPIIHRAIDKKKIDDKWYFKTKGDNNLVADGGYKFINKSKDYDYIVIEYNDSDVIYISETEVLGIVIFTIPYIGYIKIFFPLIFVTLIGLTIFYIVLKTFNYKIEIVKVRDDLDKS
ncbi:MAG: signal peptidase I [Promethearchaeota archaeon]|nr:MAG: signal peptidase I [Candidatus Lokiarchaeota archaeon]